MKHMYLKTMPQWMWLLLSLATILSHMVLMLAAAAVSSMLPPTSAPRPGCPSMCGEVNIPYPFGIGDDCAWPGGDNFTITCDNSYSLPRPYYSVHNQSYEIINISVETGEMRVFSSFASICFNSSNTTEEKSGWHLNYIKSPFLVSPTRNQFTAIGGNTLAFMEGREDLTYYTGCVTSSITLAGAARDGDDCTGLGCCQTAVAGNLSFVHIYWTNKLVQTPINNAWRYSPCGYAFLAEKGWYKFNRRDLVRHGNDTFATRVGKRSIPVVLDWAIRDGSCQSASACVSSNSYCVNATQGPGYLCNCSNGYTGNPYVTGGCKNINECDLRKSNPDKYGKLYPCHSGGTCLDTEGDYICKCGFGLRGDGKSDTGCHPIFPVYSIAILATFVATVLGCIAIILLQTRNKRKIFTKNGGKILAGYGITIFSERDLKKITNGYSKRLGGGHFGNVYEGKINAPQAQKVAVKCSVAKSVMAFPFHWKKMIRRHEVPQQGQEEDGSFINEIKFQFHNTHNNMVKLLGCCLETEIPILVFEFVSNGSLHDALHGAKKMCTLSLLKRLDIAIGSAEALSYMHSLDNHKHVHGDIKPANILLDDDLNPKVSDFGSSKLLSVGTNYARAVAADMSYMDPVYLKTHHFTLECDVYSFGVVLLELITRKTAMYVENLDEYSSLGTTPSPMSLNQTPPLNQTLLKCLPVEFVKCFKDKGSGRTMYDTEIEFSGDDAQSQRNMKCLDKIGMLAVRCLKEHKVERPTMAKVVEELKEIKEIACGGTLSYSEASRKNPDESSEA